MGYLSATATALYYVAYPIVFILTLVFYALVIITAPLLHLGHYFLYACWYPIHLLGKFETLYIFFGVAALIGLLTGTSLHYVSAFFISLLNLESLPEEQRGRTLASYHTKEEGREKDDQLLKLKHRGGLSRNDGALKDEYVNWSLSKQERGRGKKVPTTILEEDDSLEDEF